MLGKKENKNKNTEKGRQNQRRAEEACGPEEECRRMQNMHQRLMRADFQVPRRGLCGDRALELRLEIRCQWCE